MDLAQAIEPSLQWARAQADAKNIELNQEGFDQTLVVFADVVRVEQIAWNLMSNAIKFTDAGGRIAVRLSSSGEDAVLEISDNGRGMAPAFLPHVFDMFRQEEGYRTRREGGMGIGLGLVKALVTLHGGSVIAESKGPGHGANFKVSLPLHEQTELSELDVLAPTDRPLQGLRILLVDDTLDTLETFSMLLEAEGGVVTCANSGSAALALCGSNQFDLLISDVGMPEMDGNQLVALLRRRPETAGLPSIALTGYGRPQDIRAAADAGFNAHLTKPVDMEKLRRFAREFQTAGPRH